MADFYGKLFQGIYDSTIAEDYRVRLVFQDMIVLSDEDGKLDMTIEAFCRRTNVPRRMVERAIEILTQPDPSSRNREEEGRRIVPLDPERDWGWEVVNKARYRDIASDAHRREKARIRKQRQRDRDKSQGSHATSRKSRHTDTDTNTDTSEEQSSSDLPWTMKFPVRSPGGDAVWLLGWEKREEWEQTYPQMDVVAELSRARQWLRDNPAKLKTPRGMTRFLGAWLSRANDGGKYIPRAGAPERFGPYHEARVLFLKEIERTPGWEDATTRNRIEKAVSKCRTEDDLAKLFVSFTGRSLEL